ncbi:MAG TPA: cation diffusion facilitator family transporter [Candidatus Thermoplasmatota archaeon]|nr:cation diffusion facilitator family transporter [Candidatus Thermoplasmatota archaeon]
MSAHGHGHDHGARADDVASNRRRLAIVATVAGLIIVIEAAAGFLANSLVLLSDAGHASTDFAALLLAAYAVSVAARPATAEKTFGYRRSEIVAAFVNALGLWVISAVLVVEAARRLLEPGEVDGDIVIAVGLVTLVANGGMALFLSRGAHANLNVEGARLHILSDAVGSAAAVVAGLAVKFQGWTWADPAITLFVTFLIVRWALRLTRETLHILLEGAPARVDPNRLRADLTAIPGVIQVHDLHVWSLTAGVDTMSAHVVVDDPARGPEITARIRRDVAPKYRLEHLTLEVEAADSDCEGCEPLRRGASA